MPVAARFTQRRAGPGNPGRFWEQVCALCKIGQDGIADPFAAISTMPAATGAVRDMSGVRLEVPEFIAAKCTGCGQCWTQCPDAAIPGSRQQHRGCAQRCDRDIVNGLRWSACGRSRSTGHAKRGS